MAARGNLRGHPIYWDGEQYRYEDDNTPTVTGHKERDCDKCRLPNRKDGHDACLGELPSVMNACCGHGDVDEAYIQYPDNTRIAGEEAITEMNKLIARRESEDENKRTV